MTGRHVALIRGINVGHAKRVAMADLRKLFEDLGYREVRTLGNSGNVVFTPGWSWTVKQPTRASLAAVAALHRKNPPVITQFTLNRSTSQPDTSWKQAYVQKNAENKKPSWLAEMPSSSFSMGAARERLTRSM